MNTPTNKKMLWELLYKNKLFSDLKNSDLNNVIAKFEENINMINSKYSEESLLDQNKLFISTFINILKEFNLSKNNSDTSQIYKREDAHNSSEIYKREDIRNIELKDFSDKHNKIVEEFNKFKPSPPPEINFSDDVQEETTDISTALNNLNNERNNEISIQSLFKLMTEIKENQLTILSHIKSSNMDYSANNIDLLQ